MFQKSVLINLTVGGTHDDIIDNLSFFMVIR